jgi:toxin ParE1/3/4
VRTRPVVPRERATRDVHEAIDHCLSENVPEAALGFIDALEDAFDHIRRHPDAGSSRYAGELNLPGLRFWPLNKYPHLVFYLVRSDHIDVWAVLHGKRDIPAWMQEPDQL